ncbi:unnamed protein product [Dovyalis caffra]|uniref:BURP domain-containing protein n=1 Tax=Dovyalis caffra TaxID=77055 RepID=A0AAV1SN36_9ROSI|nr:unnamed protein product [Dovyalis caffra]
MAFNKRRNTAYKKMYNKTYKKARDPTTTEESMKDGIATNDGIKSESTFLEDDMAFNKRRNTAYKSRYNKTYKKARDSVTTEESMKDGVTTNDDDMAFNKRRNTAYKKMYNKTYKKARDPTTTEESMKDGIATNDGIKSESTFLEDDMAFNKRRNTAYKSRYNKTYKKACDSVTTEESMKDGVTTNDDKKEIEGTFPYDDDTVINDWIDENDDLADTAIFYLYRGLYPGKKMKLLFNNAGSRAGFLPRQMAESIPFSSDSVPKILEHFSLKTDSAEASIIADTIDECEYPKMEGEEKYCPTSLESLIDFVVARLGSNVKVLSTQSGKKQEYTALTGGKMIGDRAVVCHKEIYPYAVYYCHEIEDTKAFMVPLVAADGTTVKAVTICHDDTSTWSPEHVSFELLKVKPGVPICHFLANDTLVWVKAKDAERDFITHLAMPITDQ